MSNPIQLDVLTDAVFAAAMEEARDQQNRDQLARRRDDRFVAPARDVENNNGW